MASPGCLRCAKAVGNPAPGDQDKPRMMPMVLNRADRKMLTDRVLARLARERPEGCATNEDLRAAIQVEAAALVAEGAFIFRDGALMRRCTIQHQCDNGWISVEDPIMGGLIDSRCPECSP